jgi:hypothetical protein
LNAKQINVLLLKRFEFLFCFFANNHFNWKEFEFLHSFKSWCKKFHLKICKLDFFHRFSGHTSSQNTSI